MLLAGMRWARRIAAATPLAWMIEHEAAPGNAAMSDGALLDFAARTASTVHHPVGTCRMGSDAQSVVDAELRVRGVERLRVIDASVMPAITSGNPNAPTVMIAERAADLILGRTLLA